MRYLAHLTTNILITLILITALLSWLVVRFVAVYAALGVLAVLGHYLWKHKSLVKETNNSDIRNG